MVLLSEDNTASIDQDYSDCDDVVKCTNTIDSVLIDYDNSDLDTNWYDVIDIVSVQIGHQFICEGIFISDIFHEEDFYPSIDDDYNVDDYIQKKTNISYTNFYPSVSTVYIEDDIIQMKIKTDYNNFDKLYFYDDFWAQMNNRAKCSMTNISNGMTKTSNLLFI